MSSRIPSRILAPSARASSSKASTTLLPTTRPCPPLPSSSSFASSSRHPLSTTTRSPSRLSSFTTSASLTSLLRRPFSISSHRPSSRSNPDPESSSSSPPPDEPEPTSAFQRFKLLSKKYGWWAVLIYNLLGLVDLSIAYVLVESIGEDKVARGEKAVVGWVYDKAGWGERLPREGASERGSFWTKFALAYAIHKTLFLPTRVALTTVVTPRFVAYLTRHGWAGKGVAGVRVKAKEVADKVSKKTKDAVKDRKS